MITCCMFVCHESWIVTLKEQPPRTIQNQFKSFHYQIRIVTWLIQVITWLIGPHRKCDPASPKFIPSSSPQAPRESCHTSVNQTATQYISLSRVDVQCNVDNPTTSNHHVRPILVNHIHSKDKPSYCRNVWATQISAQADRALPPSLRLISIEPVYLP